MSDSLQSPPPEDPVISSPKPSATEAAPQSPANPTNGQSKQQPAKPKGQQQPKAASKPESSASAPAGEKKLSAKELKEQKKLEKQARRAQAKGEASKDGGSAPGGSSEGRAQQQQQKKGGNQQQKGGQNQNQQGHQQQHRKGGQQQYHAQGPSAGDRKTVDLAFHHIDSSKEVALFKHLEDTKKKKDMSEGVVPTEGIHPSVVQLGLKMITYDICGSVARLVATLLAFKQVILDYTTPPGASLNRDLNHHLSPQIQYLNAARPNATSVRNAIRWLKVEISSSPIDISDEEAKERLTERIDAFIQEKVMAAGRVIAESAAEKIRDGDVIVTYAKSSVVQQALLEAHKRGKKFKVCVIDSRPRFEGKNLARALGTSGIDTQYALITSLNYIMTTMNVTKVFLGAHAMLGNGYLYSRVGTAMVAMMAKDTDIPVIVLSESIKFTDRVQLDSIVQNERAPESELVITEDDDSYSGGPGLKDWEKVQNLQLLNILYDVTPASYINTIITEYGSLPPSSVPVVHRLSTGT